MLKQTSKTPDNNTRPKSHEDQLEHPNTHWAWRDDTRNVKVMQLLSIMIKITASLFVCCLFVAEISKRPVCRNIACFTWKELAAPNLALSQKNSFSLTGRGKKRQNTSKKNKQKTKTTITTTSPKNEEKKNRKHTTTKQKTKKHKK